MSVTFEFDQDMIWWKLVAKGWQGIDIHEKNDL